LPQIKLSFLGNEIAMIFNESQLNMENKMNNSTTDYEGKFAVVTGASSGIGMELARVFAENGFNLLIAAETEGIHDVAKDLEAYGHTVEALQLDLSTYEGVETLYQNIIAKNMPVHSIAMNAGVGVGGEFLETDLQKEMNMIQLNIVSLVHLTKKILPDFVSRNDGRILFTSSIAAEMPGPYYAVYAASKAFVQSFAEAIRSELGETKVVITALQPGATDTNFFARADMLDTKAGKDPKKDDPRDVALDGFHALMEGKDHVVAGSFKNKIQTTMARMMPETMQAKVHSIDTKPESVKH
jgi:short-subunit dehydrogenase